MAVIEIEDTNSGIKLHNKKQNYSVNINKKNADTVRSILGDLLGKDSVEVEFSIKDLQEIPPCLNDEMPEIFPNNVKAEIPHENGRVTVLSDNEGQLLYSICDDWFCGFFGQEALDSRDAL